MPAPSYVFDIDHAIISLKTGRGTSLGTMQVEVWAQEDDILDSLEFDDAKLLSKVSDYSVDEAIKRFTPENILDEIGFEKVIEHFGGTLEVLQLIGSDAIKEHWENL